MTHVTFVVRGCENDAASSKYRVYEYLRYLKDKGISWSVIAPPKRKIVHAYAWIPFFVRLIFCGLFSRTIFVQKDIFSLTVWRVFKFLGKKIIYDFDDAIFVSDNLNEQPYFSFINFIRRGFDRLLLEKMISISDLVIVANKYLENFAKKHSEKTLIIPMSLNIKNYQLKEHREQFPVVIGWIGSPHTTPYLITIHEALNSIKSAYSEKAKIKIVSNGKVELPNIEFDQISWDPQNEMRNILSFDIGLCPLPEDSWTPGKSSFKLLQYMACGLPTVCSSVGFNEEAIDDEKNGLLARNVDEWVHKLSRLIDDFTLREKLGREARKTIEKRFSLKSNSELFAKAITDA